MKVMIFLTLLSNAVQCWVVTHPQRLTTLLRISRVNSHISGISRVNSHLSGISPKRREELGLTDEDDEYDLGVALANNTDDTISKIIAGSLILAIASLLVVGLVIPNTTDFGQACVPSKHAGRCPPPELNY